MIDHPVRQVHLDFHTSEFIPGVGSRFDKKQFQEALKAGHVGAINIFGKCHHGWSYYPTKAGAVHPTLDTDLLGQQIDACHEIGVRAPVYITVGWCAKDAEDHPEWVKKDKSGKPSGMNFDFSAAPGAPKPNCSWKNMCVGTPYRDLILAQSKEICENYDVDGLWYDICFGFGQPCYCSYCRKGMVEMGLNPENYDDAMTYLAHVWKEFQKDTKALLMQYHPNATIFWNGGCNPGDAQFHEPYTQYELEDLPSAWGGYDKLPPRAKFFYRYGKQIIAMSGKFHTDWGEFGGFKNPEALKFECAMMLAYGARCSIGDQLHPQGLMDMETYRTIGEAFSYVKSIEEYCLKGTPVADLGLWLSGNSSSDEGAANMLLEAQIDFLVVDEEEDLSRYQCIILPDSVSLTDGQAARLNAFVGAGGNLLVTGDSGTNAGRTEFLLDMGLAYMGKSLYEKDYLLVGRQIAENMVTSPILVYEGAVQTSEKGGCKGNCDSCAGGGAPPEVLAWVKEPFFNRTYSHYCSHKNTPYKPEDAAYPAAIRKTAGRGTVVYLAHPIFRVYRQYGALYHRRYFENALALIYTQPPFTAELPSCGRVTMWHQPEDRRYVGHILYGTPIQRGNTSVIEDLVELSDVTVTAKVPDIINKVVLIPQKIELPFTQAGEMVTYTLPKFQCHQVVVMQY